MIDSSTIREPERLRTAIHFKHYTFCSENNPSFVVQPDKVAKAARFLADKLRISSLGLVTGQDVAAATYAGLCIYAIEHYDYSYLRLSHAASPQVACLVRDVTPDIRRAPDEGRLDQLSRAPGLRPLAQLVRLAEIRCIADDLLARATPSWIRDGAIDGARNAYELQCWTDFAHNYLSAISRGVLSGEAFARIRHKATSDVVELHRRANVRGQRRIAAREAVAAPACAACDVVAAPGLEPSSPAGEGVLCS